MEERLSEKFATIDELMVDLYFKEQLAELLVKFENRKDAPAGMHYKRGKYEYLVEGKYLTVERFTALFNVINRRIGPKHPMAVREFVKDVIIAVSVETIKHYRSLDILDTVDPIPDNDEVCQICGGEMEQFDGEYKQHQHDYDSEPEVTVIWESFKCKQCGNIISNEPEK